MELTFTYPIIALVLAALFAGGATFWVYRDTVPALSTARRRFLGALRFLTLTIIFFLLAEPLVSRIISNTEDPILAILVDESQSMSLTESSATQPVRADSLSEILQQIASATSSERYRVFGFGSQSRDLPSLDSVQTKSSRTDISSGLDHVRTSLENEPLGAVILVSDGRHNGGRNPEHVADLYPVPIISITVGDTTIQKDIRIQQVLTNDLSYVGREVPVRIRIRNEGFDVQPIQVRLVDGASSLDSESLNLPPPGSEIEVDLTFVPDSVGLFQYRIELSQLRGEITHRNNTESFSLQILEREKRILLLAGAPSPDLSAMRQQLQSDRDTDLIVRTEKPNGVAGYYEGVLPSDYDDLDLIILVGYPTRRTPQAIIDRIVGGVESGTPVLFVLDRSADLVAIQRNLSTVLPARPAVIRPGYIEGGFVPTERALRHAIFEISDRRNVQRWLSLPPLSLNQTRWETAPASTVLATTRIRGISIDDAILVVGKIGNRRSAALLASGFWRWNNVPEDLEEDAERWRQLSSNLIQWLVTSEDDRLVRVAPFESLLDEGDPVLFGGQVYDENLRPLSDVSVALEVRHPTGEIFPYTLQSIGNGQYRLDLGSLPHGTYSYVATATRDSGVLGTDRGSFTIGAMSIEFRNPYADARLMRQIAGRSGGVALSADRISEIPAILSSFSSYAPVTNTVESQLRLWRSLPFLFVILSLMTLEWFFRKRFGLV